MYRLKLLIVTAVADRSLRQLSIQRNSTNRRHLEVVTNARIQSSSLYYSVARAAGTAANGQRAGFRQHRGTPRLFLWLLRLCSICLRTRWLLWAGLFL
jgi:hypothetical protein